jgi:Holliday junction DNA helicase RuvA
MIAKLRGTVDSILSDSIVVEVCGVGYQVYVSEKLKEALEIGAEVTIRTLHVFKQDAQFLCGFQDDVELTMFKALLAVPGVGMKTALSVLSALSPEEFASAIAAQDSSIICKTHGIGKKTAERILLELKDRVLMQLGTPVGKYGENISDAILGLVSLGYQKSSVLKDVLNIADKLGENSSPSDIIVRYLKIAAGKAES